MLLSSFKKKKNLLVVDFVPQIAYVDLFSLRVEHLTFKIATFKTKYINSSSS